MKRLVTILVSLLITLSMFGQNIGNELIDKPEDKKPIQRPGSVCDCGTWGSFLVQNTEGKYECGKEIVGSCNKKFDFRSSYQCKSNEAGCVATTKWKVAKDEVNIATGNGLIGSFTPTSNGVYTLTLNAYCKGKECQPCIYTIYVRDCSPIVCKCNDRNWDAKSKITISNGEKVTSEEVICSGKIQSPVIVGSEIKYDAQPYICNPGECKAIYQWKIINILTGAVSLNGETSSLPFTFKAPRIAGDFKVEIFPVCGTKLCEPCLFSFTTYQCIKIGQNYGGGIVFYVDSTCLHGLIATPNDQTAVLPFVSGGMTVFSVPQPLPCTIGTGSQSTNIFYNMNWLNYNYWFSVNSALGQCLDLTLNGFSDWFVPSKDELNLLYQQKNIVGGFGTGDYWSSTGSYTITGSNATLAYTYHDEAWCQQFSNGVQKHVDWHLSKNARAVRAF